MPLPEAIARRRDELTRWRRDLHAHPELGFGERRTADFVAERLREWGIQVHAGIGGTGVVGVLREGNETRSIGLRADMDALPIVEGNAFDHRSRNDGVMHACGHDGHTVMLLGAARHLAETRNFSGQIHFIFQPAEEGLGGAKAMIDDGLFRDFPCDSIYAMHNAPGMAVGEFGAREGVITAAGAFFDIEVRGVGAHAAHPDHGVDPVVTGAHVVVALQSVVARGLPPAETAVLSITRFHAGDAYNVIPATARLAGTARAFRMEAMKTMEARVTEIAEGVAAAHGAEANVDFRVIFQPVVNDAAAAEAAAGACAELVGEARVHRDLPASTGSEDFSFLLGETPGCYVLIGNGKGEGSRPLHNPGYDFNDDALPFGASFFARLAERQLAR